MRRYLLLLLALAALSESAFAQRGGGGSRGGGGNLSCSFAQWDGPYYIHPDHRGNPPYDGRFTLARAQYSGSFRCSEGPGWAHDYPVAETNFVQILRELTNMRPNMDRFAIVRLDSPELFRYPALYFSEPGGWTPNEKEVVGLRNYLQKGGFLIFDDFEGGDWPNTVYQLRRVLPDAEALPLPLDHVIFDSFFHITEPWKSGSGVNAVDFYAIFEDNDPTKRVIAVLNYNNDLGENWQFSATGMVPIDRSNESYKLGINYYIYALTR